MIPGLDDQGAALSKPPAEEPAATDPAKVKKLAAVAGDLGTTLPRLGLAWCLKNPRVSSVITGASKPSQVKENMKAGELVDQLTGEVMARIAAVLGAG